MKIFGTPKRTMDLVPNRESPIFNEIDSMPEEKGDAYKLKLCFCPFCQVGIKALGLDKPENHKKVVSWQLLCRAVMYSLSVLNAPRLYFSLKKDVYWFISDHWYCFGKMAQFTTSPSKWKKSLLDALSHSTLFESGTNSLRKTGMWKLTHATPPWDVQTTPIEKEIIIEPKPIKDVEVKERKVLKVDKKRIKDIKDEVLSKFSQEENKQNVKKQCEDALVLYQKAYDQMEAETKSSQVDEVLIGQMKEMKSVMKMVMSIITSLDDKKDEQNAVLLVHSVN
ncbi:hypothetical protein EIN_222270 [Entamoeba invadens IP1]|uniref:Uncharacterized protein n=1 Tax=Entamoeba invadens IP1 TaxID=370355 RepID=A0A0A1U238_ENTIV|nr:hypothetical protein EIN_222270 [Entamoeba invadens IP1]ELP88084.1 hypothetical protein EIN_222270 [Entamoeba invadens IP1]|eukprot:XP_004254855.1 hypothetical protein EIN_222270 [Entamoeba invadens IP1]